MLRPVVFLEVGVQYALDRQKFKANLGTERERIV